MKRRVLLAGLITIFLSACASATPVPTATPTVPLLPTSVPTFTPTSVPARVDLRVVAGVVNCRFGPGTVFELINELSEGQSAREGPGRDYRQVAAICAPQSDSRPSTCRKSHRDPSARPA
jgi:hypothetical protein